MYCLDSIHDAWHETSLQSRLVALGLLLRHAVNFAKVTYARAYSKYYFGYKKITEDQFARTHIIMAEYCEMVNSKGKRHLFKC